MNSVNNSIFIHPDHALLLLLLSPPIPSNLFTFLSIQIRSDLYFTTNSSLLKIFYFNNWTIRWWGGALHMMLTYMLSLKLLLERAQIPRTSSLHKSPSKRQAYGTIKFKLMMCFAVWVNDSISLAFSHFKLLYRCSSHLICSVHAQQWY